MASHHQQITRMKTASKAGWVRSFIVFGKDIWSAVQTLSLLRRLSELLAGSGSPAWEMMNVESRQAGEESGPAVWRLTVRSYSDGLSVVYQMTGAEVRHSAGGAVSLSLSLCLSPHSRSGLVGSWNTHTSVSHGALVSPPATMTVSPDRPISRSSPTLPRTPPPQKVPPWKSGTEERDVVVV